MIVDAQSEWKGTWIPLLSDLDQLDWRFFDPRTGKWTAEWPAADAKPSLIEITLKLGGRSHQELLTDWSVNFKLTLCAAQALLKRDRQQLVADS